VELGSATVDICYVEIEVLGIGLQSLLASNIEGTYHSDWPIYCNSDLKRTNQIVRTAKNQH
jgi:hypothetical protein